MDHLTKKGYKIAKAVYNAATNPDQYQRPHPGSQPGQYPPPPQHFQYPPQQQQLQQPYPPYGQPNPSYFPQNAGQPMLPAPYPSPMYQGPANSPPGFNHQPGMGGYGPLPINPHLGPYNLPPQPNFHWQQPLSPPTPMSPPTWPAAPNSVPLVPPPLPPRLPSSQYSPPVQTPHTGVSPNQANFPYTPSGQETGYIPNSGYPGYTAHQDLPPLSQIQSFPISPVNTPLPQQQISHSQSFPNQPPQKHTRPKPKVSFNLSPEQIPDYVPTSAIEPPTPPSAQSSTSPSNQKPAGFIAELSADPPANTMSHIPVELAADPIPSEEEAANAAKANQAAVKPSPTRQAAHPYDSFHPPSTFTHKIAGDKQNQPEQLQSFAPPLVNYSSRPTIGAQPSGHPEAIPIEAIASPQPVLATPAEISVQRLDQPKPLHPESSAKATAHHIATMTPMSPAAGKVQAVGTQIASLNPPNDFSVNSNSKKPVYSPERFDGMSSLVANADGQQNTTGGSLAAAMEKINVKDSSNQDLGHPARHTVPHQNGPQDSKTPSYESHTNHNQPGYIPARLQEQATDHSHDYSEQPPPYQP